MRRLALVLLFALPMFGEVYEIHSSQYLLTVETTDAAYNVSVTDLDARTAIASERFTRGQDQTSRLVKVSGGRELNVRLDARDGRLNAQLIVKRDGKMIDMLHATWMTGAEPVSPPVGDQPYRVGGDVKAPVVIRRVEPMYTEEARERRISGIVIIEAIIDRTGRVTDAKVLKPLPYGLDQMALDAIRQWEFRPATLNGEPVEVFFNLTMNFKLE